MWHENIETYLTHSSTTHFPVSWGQLMIALTQFLKHTCAPSLLSTHWEHTDALIHVGWQPWSIKRGRAELQEDTWPCISRSNCTQYDLLYTRHQLIIWIRWFHLNPQTSSLEVGVVPCSYKDVQKLEFYRAYLATISKALLCRIFIVSFKFIALQILACCVSHLTSQNTIL